MLAEQGDPESAGRTPSPSNGLPKEDNHGQPTKVALFTTYKDTAHHLFKHFGGDIESLKNGVRVQSNLARTGSWMSLLTGGDDQNRRRAVLQHFGASRVLTVRPSLWMIQALLRKDRASAEPRASNY